MGAIMTPNREAGGPEDKRCEAAFVWIDCEVLPHSRFFAGFPC